jgi:hypothetical protein
LLPGVRDSADEGSLGLGESGLQVGPKLVVGDAEERR